MPDEPLTPLGNIEPIEIQEEMERSFLDYAMSVITSRALPDARDGLKPVQRRILYGMYTEGMRPDRQHRKSANAVGNGDGELPPARRPVDLRRARPDGAGLLAALPARRRARELRFTRPRRPARRAALHRSAPRAARDGVARRDRRGDRRLRRHLRRPAPAAIGAAGALPEPACERWRRHRRRDGHEHPAAQPARGHRRGRCTSSTTPKPPPKTSCSSCTGPDFPTGATILGRIGINEVVPHRARLDPHARGRRDRRVDARRAAHRRHRGPVPDVGRGDRHRRSPSS